MVVIIVITLVVVLLFVIFSKLIYKVEQNVEQKIKTQDDTKVKQRGKLFTQVVDTMINRKKTNTVYWHSMKHTNSTQALYVWRSGSNLCFIPYYYRSSSGDFKTIIDTHFKSDTPDEKFKVFMQDVQNFTTNFSGGALFTRKIPIDKIIFCGMAGDVRDKYNPVDGKGFSTKGAVVGGLLAGQTGAMIGGMRNTKPSTFTVSEVDTRCMELHIMGYTNPFKFDASDFSIFYELIPEKCKT